MEGQIHKLFSLGDRSLFWDAISARRTKLQRQKMCHIKRTQQTASTAIDNAEEYVSSADGPKSFCHLHKLIHFIYGWHINGGNGPAHLSFCCEFCSRCISLNCSGGGIVRHTKVNFETQFVNGNINSHIFGT